MIETQMSHRLMERVKALVRRFSIIERADLSCCGMTAAQAATLDILRREPNLRLGELGRRLGISSSTLTRNLERLQQRGLVVTSPDPADRRASIVAVTTAGDAAAAEVACIEDGFANAIVADLGAETADQVVQLLDRLLAAVRLASDDCCPGAFDHLMSESLSGGKETDHHGEHEAI